LQDLMETPTPTPGAGPRPRRRLPWQRPRSLRRGPRWWFEHHFPLRLLLALVAAGSLLAVVDRWENCREHQFQRGCLTRNADGVISIGNVESLSIVTAAFLYLFEGTQRRQRENLAAMEVILACQQARARLSHARNDALETLSRRGIWLDGLDLSHAQLDALIAPHARWRGVRLQQASLQRACLQDTDLQDADLSGADLRQARLEHADLRRAVLSGTDLRGADLRGADLRDAIIEGALLEAARLEGADLGDLDQAPADPPQEAGAGKAS
jgi:uncharacterized protein YjbI with pentapeptide repeats